MGGGILPAAIHKGKLYFLFSREYIHSKDDGGMWSDFGGSKDHNETYDQTAFREGWEESSGILGTKTDIKNLMKYKTLKTITIRGYRVYIVLINYNKNLPKQFRKKFLNIEKNNPELIHKKNGLYEKDMLKWIEYSKLRSHYKYFRIWYRSIIKEILRKF